MIGIILIVGVSIAGIIVDVMGGAAVAFDEK